jgi:hypothetical protein
MQGDLSAREWVKINLADETRDIPAHGTQPALQESSVSKQLTACAFCSN